MFDLHQNPSTYCTLKLTATDQHIDPNNHINNIMYLQWMQDVAIKHVVDNGVNKITDAKALTWFAKQHTIDYESQGFLGDQLTVVTWVESITKISTLRKYHIYRNSDQQLLCKGQTKWIMINRKTGKPTKIPTEVVEKIHLTDGSSAISHII